MAEINIVALSGRLTKDPSLVEGRPEGKELCAFTIAQNTWDSSQEKEVVQYHNCVAYSRVAINMVAQLKKGNKVGVEGYIYSSQYTDKDGKNRTSVSVSCSKVSYFEWGSR